MQWSDESFKDACASNHPVRLSVGYAACHPCHAMAHESCREPRRRCGDNELFVNIKVDRKERRDIDSVCMGTRHDFDLAKRQSTHMDW